MSESRLVDETFERPEQLGAAILYAANLGLLDITVTTVVTPKFEHLPLRVTYHLDAVKPAAPSRSLQSTRTGS